MLPGEVLSNLRPPFNTPFTEAKEKNEDVGEFNFGWQKVEGNLVVYIFSVKQSDLLFPEIEGQKIEDEDLKLRLWKPMRAPRWETWNERQAMGRVQLRGKP